MASLSEVLEPMQLIFLTLVPQTPQKMWGIISFEGGRSGMCILGIHFLQKFTHNATVYDQKRVAKRHFVIAEKIQLF